MRRRKGSREAAERHEARRYEATELVRQLVKLPQPQFDSIAVNEGFMMLAALREATHELELALGVEQP